MESRSEPLFEGINRGNVVGIGESNDQHGMRQLMYVYETKDGSLCSFLHSGA